MHKLRRVTFTVIVPTYSLDARSKVDAELQAKHEIAMNIVQYVIDNATQQADPIGHRGTMIKGDYFVISPNDLEAYVQRRINARIIDITTNKIRGRNVSYAILDDNIGD